MREIWRQNHLSDLRHSFQRLGVLGNVVLWDLDAPDVDEGVGRLQPRVVLKKKANL